MSKNLRILKQKVILAEGIDAFYFLIWALKAYHVDDVQVFDFGGITQLSRFIATFKNLDSYESITALVIARDAETNYTSAFQSIIDSLRSSSLPVPTEPFTYQQGAPKTAIMLFPGINESGELVNGCLEHLCLNTVTDETIQTTSNYINSIKKKHESLTHEHKSKLHAYLAAKNKFVGCKLGEAAKFGAWDWDSIYLEPFKKIITSM